METKQSFLLNGNPFQSTKETFLSTNKTALTSKKIILSTNLWHWGKNIRIDTKSLLLINVTIISPNYYVLTLFSTILLFKNHAKNYLCDFVQPQKTNSIFLKYVLSLNKTKMRVIPNKSTLLVMVSLVCVGFLGSESSSILSRGPSPFWNKGGHLFTILNNEPAQWARPFMSLRSFHYDRCLIRTWGELSQQVGALPMCYHICAYNENFYNMQPNLHKTIQYFSSKTSPMSHPNLLTTSH